MKSGLVVASCAVLMVGILLSNTYISVSAELEAEVEAYADAGGYCGNNCKVRCARAGVLDRCLKYCGICCAKCKCVPEGTYGNKHQCPCYRDMVNSKGKPKCP